MTIFYPDISAFQGNISLAGTVAVCAKATEGTSWTSPNYVWQKGEAVRRGAFFFAYHFLHAGNAAAQAQHCFNVVGKTPLMLDFEPSSTRPSVSDALAFVDKFRALGGIVNLLYLPHWYWQQLGSPSLSAFVSRKMFLVSSNYVSYSDSGPGWVGYGGMGVAIWQFSSSFSFSGQRVDFNAFKGSVSELIKLVTGSGGDPVVSHPTLRLGDTGDAVKEMQARINVWNAAHPALSIDGDFGPSTLAGLREFQKEHHLTIDGVCGPNTWAALLKNPDPPKPPAGQLAAPANFKYAGKRVSIGVRWDAVPDPENMLTGYTVQCWQMNGVKAGEQVVTGTSARFDLLVVGWKYRFKVFANGGSVAPLASEFTLTV